MSQLISMEFPLNHASTAVELTRLGLADAVVSIERVTEAVTLALLRVPDADGPRVRALLGWPNPANPPPYDLSIDKRWVPPRHRH